MAQFSEDTWIRIESYQKAYFPDSSYSINEDVHSDRQTWNIDKNIKREKKIDLSNDLLFRYVKDLSNMINPSLGNKANINIIQSSNNYKNLLLKYLPDSEHFGNNPMLYQLGSWGAYLCREGRLILEIIGIYNKQNMQFFAYKLHKLENDFCKIKNNNIIYYAPDNNNNNNKKRKEIIPLSKCIIIEFPKVLGGFEEFQNRIDRINKLGHQFNYPLDKKNPSNNLNYIQNRTTNFNKIICSWGSFDYQENLTEFFNFFLMLKFKYTTLLCRNELINGLKQLISYLNEKLGENAAIDDNTFQEELKQFPQKIDEWLEGNLSFEEANKLLF